ncbi:hypothetical protein J6590_020801 [Homalodisca vitripennis]|nr:hypothetical protein J6590_020801 [Homalodisca vitripennis]
MTAPAMAAPRLRSMQEEEPKNCSKYGGGENKNLGEFFKLSPAVGVRGSGTDCVGERAPMMEGMTAPAVFFYWLPAREKEHNELKLRPTCRNFSLFYVRYRPPPCRTFA